ncbi:hypothetical protein C0995_005137 [Termitomyces sp. Mi166|nr:hypothetical protein C0995_005137 [Termitomyces sp. Mi166\
MYPHQFFYDSNFPIPKIRWYLTGVIALLVLAHFCFGIETVVFLFVKKELAKLSEITLFAAMPLALFAVLSDIFIAISLVILLWGSRTGFQNIRKQPSCNFEQPEQAAWK